MVICYQPAPDKLDRLQNNDLLSVMVWGWESKLMSALIYFRVFIKYVLLTE